MKKLLLIALFTLLFSAKIYASDDIIIAKGPEITFEDAKNAPMPYSLKRSTVTSAKYYDQLPELEQNYYNDLEENIETLINGTAEYQYVFSINITPGLTNSEEIFADIWNTIGIAPSTYIFRPIYALTYLDKPQYFWLDINNISATYGYLSTSSLSTGEIDVIISFSPKDTIGSYLPNCYTSEEQVSADYTAMMAKANEIVANIPKNSTDWGKINYYMNWFRDNCNYNESNNATRQQYLPTSALLYGMTADNAPVCEGYAEALKILCDLSNIDSMCVESTYELDGALTGHKWNLINLNGKFYHCDPTWFDNIDSFNSYQFISTGSVSMAEYDDTLNHTITIQFSLSSPPISSTDYLEDFGIPSYNLLNIDGNKAINTADTAKLLRIISGIASGTAIDVNNDGNKDINDVIKIQNLMFN